jgi:thiol:disulfide interchange protein
LSSVFAADAQAKKVAKKVPAKKKAAVKAIAKPVAKLTVVKTVEIAKVQPAKIYDNSGGFEREKFDPRRNPDTDLKDAIAKATAENKRIILDVGGEWCGWCRLMDKFIYQNAVLGELERNNYIWVKINMSEENENKAFLASYPRASGYPHLFVLEKDGTLLQSQDTSLLEDGGKSYDLEKFTEFLIKWSPENAAVKETK